MPAEPFSYEVKSVDLELVDKPARRGRPVTLNPRRFLSICHHIEHGFSIPNACEVEGISYRNFRFRVSQSARLQERLKEAETVRFNFRHEQALASIMAAGERSWMAHAWFLERALPHMWALRTVSRPELDKDEPEPELPSEVLKRHRDLLLRLAKEDAEKQALGNSEA
jgi:hypothetical protein